MSLIVLNSQGQDPAEFENHFGRGLKLPKNAEICLCGVNLNKYEKEQGANIVQDINDTFVMNWGGFEVGKYTAFSPWKVQIPSGCYTATELASAIATSMRGRWENGCDVQPSCLRYGALSAAISASKLKFNCKRMYQFQVSPDLTAPIIKDKWFGGCGTFPTNSGTGKVEADIVPWTAIDESYVDWLPTPTCQTLLKLDPLWIGSNGSSPQQPTTAALAIYGGPGRITPAHELGYRWGFVLDDTSTFEYMKTLRGGIFRGWRQDGVNTSSGLNHYSQSSNRKDLKLNWQLGQPKFDVFWTIESFNPAGAGSFTAAVWYVPIDNNNDNNYDENNRIKVGEGSLVRGAAGTPNYCEIIFRPVDGTGGTDATAASVAVAADKLRCCLDFRIVNAPMATIAAPTGGLVRYMTSGGAAGYVAITGGFESASNPPPGKLDLYKSAPIHMGCVAGIGGFTDGVRIKMAGIEHNPPAADVQSMANINGNAAYANAGITIAGMENSFQELTYAFSPQTENLDVGKVDPHFVSSSKRCANIASAIGFKENVMFLLKSADTGAGAGLDSEFEVDSWSDKETLCVVQLPDVPIDGELGGGSGNYGGSNSANILGVVGLIAVNNEVANNVYREVNMENWIKLKNYGHHAINQLKVKLTDTTGRKLKCLQPESTIWIKIRSCGDDPDNKTGGVNPMEKPRMDRLYNMTY